MTGKEIFIEKIEELIKDVPDFFGSDEVAASKAIQYFESLKTQKSEPKTITESGIKILKFMQDNHESYNNIFKAKDIAEGIFSSGRSVSGSMRKLVTEGFVEKNGKDPVTYTITEKGMLYVVD